MISLIPIFLEKSEIFWRSDVAVDLLQRVLNAAVHASHISRVIVCTNETTVLNLVAPFKIEAYLLKSGHVKDPDAILPFGTSAAVHYISDTLKLDIEDLLILSYKNPLISSDFINRAIGQYHTSTFPLMISGSRPVDHPCQLSTYYKIKDTGCVHIFDDNYDIDPVLLARLTDQVNNHDQDRTGRSSSGKSPAFRATKSFYHDWSSKEVARKSDVNTYFRRCSPEAISYLPIEEIGGNRHIQSATVFWIFESNQRARIIFNNEVFNNIRQPENDNNFSLQGVAFDQSANQVPMALYGTQDKAVFYLNCALEQKTSLSYLLKTVSLDEETPPCQTVNPDIHFNTANHLLPYPCQENNLSCIIYSLFEISEDDTYDFSEQFPAPVELWFGTGTHLQVNAKTGNAIMGRQDFPDIVEIDATLILLKKEILTSLKSAITSGNSDFILTPDNCAIQIDSHLDLLRYQAILRVNEK